MLGTYCFSPLLCPSLNETDISNFLKEIFHLSHSTVFLDFFALIMEEGFLISPCYSLELCIQMGISFFFILPCLSLLFSSISSSFFFFLFFSQLFLGLLRQSFCLFAFLFLRMVLITTSCAMLWTFVHSSLGALSTRYNPLNLCHFHCKIIRNLV